MSTTSSNVNVNVNNVNVNVNVNKVNVKVNVNKPHFCEHVKLSSTQDCFMYAPYADLICMGQADIYEDLTLVRHAWLSRLGHSRLLLKHTFTGECILSCGSSLAEIVFGWKVTSAANGLYELEQGAKTRPVLIIVLRIDADVITWVVLSGCLCLIARLLDDSIGRLRIPSSLEPPIHAYVVPLCILDLSHWEAARIHVCSPMHQAILQAGAAAADGDRVKLQASCTYNVNAIRFKLASAMKPLLQTAVDCCFWTLPLSYLRELAEHIGCTSRIKLIFGRVAVNLRGTCGRALNMMYSQLSYLKSNGFANGILTFQKIGDECITVLQCQCHPSAAESILCFQTVNTLIQHTHFCIRLIIP